DSDAPARPAPPLPAAATPVTRQERRALSRELATRAAVLLARADGAALPLRTGTLAVIGEQAHTVLRDWYSGELHDPVPLAEALRAGAATPATVRTTRALDGVVLEVVATGGAPGVPGAEIAPEPVLLAEDSSLRHRLRGDLGT